MAAMHGDAGLSLRERNGIVRVRVSWPAPGCAAPFPIVVFLSAADTAPEAVDALCRELCDSRCVVVLSVRTAALDTATTALEWAADHATQLEADPDRVLIGGIGSGAELAVEVAAGASEAGWPELAGQVLIDR